MPGICLCITARITVPINCRYDCSSITKAIIDLQLEITASAQRCGILYSERCLADGVVGSRLDQPFRSKCRRFSRWTQLIARSAIFLSAFPYNVLRTEKPPGVLSRII